MTERQRSLVIMGLVGIVLVGLIPPWMYTWGLASEPAGYGLLFAPPPPKLNAIGLPSGIRVDVVRLAVQWIVLSVVIGGAILLTKK